MAKKNKTIWFSMKWIVAFRAVSSAVERLKGRIIKTSYSCHSFPQVAAHGNDHCVKKNYQNNDVKIHVDKINNDQK